MSLVKKQCQASKKTTTEQLHNCLISFQFQIVLGHHGPAAAVTAESTHKNQPNYRLYYGPDSSRCSDNDTTDRREDKETEPDVARRGETTKRQTETRVVAGVYSVYASYVVGARTFCAGSQMGECAMQSSSCNRSSARRSFRKKVSASVMR